MRRTIHVLGTSGHVDTVYRTDSDLKKGETLEAGEVTEAEARKVFSQLMHEGRVPFAVEKTGDREMKKFEPKVKEVLVVF